MGNQPREHQEPTHKKPDIKPVAQNNTVTQSAEDWLKAIEAYKQERDQAIEERDNMQFEYDQAQLRAERLAKYIINLFPDMIKQTGCISKQLYNDLLKCGYSAENLMALIVKDVK